MMKPELRIHIVTVGFQIRRITEPLIRERADKVYLIKSAHEDKAIAYLDKVMKILRNEKYIQVEKRAMDIWNLFDCLKTYKKIINEEEEKGGKSAHIYINVSTGSKVSSIAGTLACMIWKGTPYYAHIYSGQELQSDNNAYYLYQLDRFRHWNIRLYTLVV